MYGNIVRDYTLSDSECLTGFHYADKGARTFTVLKGNVSVILRGKKIVLTEGDIFNAEAWFPFSMTLLCEDTVVREISAGESGTVHYLANHSKSDDAVKEKFCEVSCKGKGLYEFNTKGLSLQLKAGRWQLDGGREIWEYRPEKDYRLAFKGSERESVFMIRSGRFRIETEDRDFVAEVGGEDLVRIPAGTAHAITALSKDCCIQDFSVLSHLFRFLEMVEAARDYFPEKLDDKDYTDYLFEVNKVITFESFEKVGEN